MKMEFVIRHKKLIFWQLLIFILPFVIYADSLKAAFMFGDEQNMITNNVYLLDWKYFSRFFTENLFSGSGTLTNFWRPFQLMVYSLIAHMVGLKPWAIHFPSIFFHSLCGVLIFQLFYFFLPKSVKPGLIACIAMIWSVHPIHVEELALISGLASSGYLFWVLFGILSFVAFEKKKRLLWYFLSLAAYILALFSKESAVIFPGLLLGAHITGVKIGLFNKEKIRGYLSKHSVFWLVALSYVLARLTLLNFSNTLNFNNQDNIFTQNLLYRIFTLSTTLTHGLRIIFLPWALHPERSWPVYTNLFALPVIVSVLILTLLVIFAIAIWKKNPLASFGIFWFFFGYLPMSNIVARINSLICDHWFYLPSVGIFLSLAALFAEIKNNSYRKIILFLLAAMLIVFSWETLNLIPHYKNSKVYCRYILSYEKDSARTWNNYAMSLTGPGEEEEAIKAYTKAIELDDVYPQTHNNLGNIYLNKGNYDLAEKEYLASIELDKSFYWAYLGLGSVYLAKERTKDAILNFKQAFEIYPYLPKELVDFINQLEKQYGSTPSGQSAGK